MTRDDGQAVKLFRKAAEQGYANSQAMLGLAYEAGRGVEKDNIRAYAWYSIAAARRDWEIPKRREELKSTMSSEQLAKATNLAEELAAKYGP